MADYRNSSGHRPRGRPDRAALTIEDSSPGGSVDRAPGATRRGRLYRAARRVQPTRPTRPAADHSAATADPPLRDPTRTRRRRRHAPPRRHPMTIDYATDDRPRRRRLGARTTWTTRTSASSRSTSTRPPTSRATCPGAVGWNWTSQLADGIRRDIASREDFARAAVGARASARTRPSSCTATTTTGSRPGPTGSSSCTATTTCASSTAGASTGWTRACR